MIILSQRDPRWAAEKLGKSVCTVGRYGCTITCISMLSDYFESKGKGQFKTPGELARQLQFTPEGLLIWQSIPKVLAFKLEKRLYGNNSDEIKVSLQDPNKAVILQVENYHWVVAVNRLPFGIYRIYDPWDGKVKLSTAYKKITGSAHFLS